MFARRYLLWLLAPPALITIPLALVFISAALPLTVRGTWNVLSLLVGAFVAAALVYGRAIGPAAASVESAVARGASLSDPMSQTLERSRLVALLYWLAATLVVALLGATLFLPTAAGFAYFVTAGLIIGFPSVIWAYAGGKRQLVRFLGAHPTTVSYAGRRLSLSRKIAIVFIGSFVISSAALILLVHARLSSVAADIAQQITLYTLLIALVTTAVFIAATAILANDVRTPLRQLRTLAKEMAAGEFVSARQVFSDDEVGELAQSFGETRANLRNLIGRIGGSGSTITSGVRVITDGTESLLGRSRNQTELTERSTAAVENVRKGIRSVFGAAEGVSTQSEDASARALQLQASAEEVAKSMDYLFQSVEKTSSSTTEMHASMNEMSKRTDVLAGIGDEVLSFVSQLESMVGELRSTSEATAEISREVREDAEAGGSAVGRTVEGINADRELTESTAEVIENLAGSVGSITQMLAVIEEITNRTNLLALNAAIIAAQAGEHGIGFSVVAEEIRQLAERTRGSTSEISGVVKAVQTNSRQAVAKIREGVERVHENTALAQAAASSLEKIVDSAERSYEMATKITRGLEEQTAASRHLHEATSRMSDLIAEINRATREQARGTELLAQESERIRDIAGGVKNATSEQSNAGRGIISALETIAEESRAMRELLERQLEETARIADASRAMLTFAQQNDQIARDFNDTVQNLVRSGQAFETEVGRFRITGA